MQYANLDIRPASHDVETEETDSFHVEYANDDVAVVTYVDDGEEHRIVLRLAA
jgi:hypothetical protein